MARTDTVSVRLILPSETTLTDPQIEAAIAAATTVIDEIAKGCGKYLSAASLLQCETYLSGHFAAVTENTLSLVSEKSPTCGSSAVYGFKFGEGVAGTPFGQMANTLSGGCLKEQDKAAPSLFSIGSVGGSASDYIL